MCAFLFVSFDCCCCCYKLRSPDCLFVVVGGSRISCFLHAGYFLFAPFAQVFFCLFISSVPFFRGVLSVSSNLLMQNEMLHDAESLDSVSRFIKAKCSKAIPQHQITILSTCKSPPICCSDLRSICAPALHYCALQLCSFLSWSKLARLEGLSIRGYVDVWQCTCFVLSAVVTSFANPLKLSPALPFILRRWSLTSSGCSAGCILHKPRLERAVQWS